MSFKDLMESAQAIALSKKLLPDDEANWYYICREYSKIFHTPLHVVLDMNPEFVCTHIFSEYFSKLDLEEQGEDLIDNIGALKDPEYDAKKERAYKEELKQLQEEENKRLEKNESIHPSLDKNKKFNEESEIPQNLPKSGGLSSDLINQLQKEEKMGKF